MKRTMKYALELFAGTGSFGTEAKLHGYSVVSLDYDKKFNPTICVNILKWDYKVFPVGFFDIIWSSPDCRLYSVLQNCWIGRKHTREELEEKRRTIADPLVIRTLEIIDYLKPRAWYMENPLSSALKSRTFMARRSFCVADYCKYAEWGYKKPTIFFTNKPKKLMRCRRDCGQMEQSSNSHRISCGNESAKRGSTTLMERYRIPPLLLTELCFM